MFGFYQATISTLLITAAFASTLLALLWLVWTRRFGNDTLAASGGAIATGTRVGRPPGSLDSPEDFRPTDGNTTGRGAMTTDARHASHLT